MEFSFQKLSREQVEEFKSHQPVVGWLSILEAYSSGKADELLSNNPYFFPLDLKRRRPLQLDPLIDSEDQTLVGLESLTMFALEYNEELSAFSSSDVGYLLEEVSLSLELLTNLVLRSGAGTNTHYLAASEGYMLGRVSGAIIRNNTKTPYDYSTIRIPKNFSPSGVVKSVTTELDGIAVLCDGREGTYDRALAGILRYHAARFLTAAGHAKIFIDPLEGGWYSPRNLFKQAKRDFSYAQQFSTISPEHLDDLSRWIDIGSRQATIRTRFTPREKRD